MATLAEFVISLWTIFVQTITGTYETIMALGATYPTTAVAIGGAMIISVIVDVRRNGF